ncbi:MAG: hypothetical protein ACXWC9_08990, partial [Pseudobdellovibrionaceae bacterium]
TTEVPLNWDWILTNETETHALLEGRFSEKTPGTYVLDPSEIGILDLKTGNLVTMPTLQEPFFTKDSMNLIGTEAMPDGRLRGMLYSPVSGTRTEFCPGLSGSLMKIIEIEQGKFLIAAFETGSRILNVYTKNSSAICSKVNSAVAVGTKIDAILDISVSPDRKKILAHMGLKEVSTSGFIPKKRNQLLYIPLNGKTPAIVNFPTYDTAQISQASFLSDSQTVLYIGEQLRPGETNVFLWKASN